MPRLHARPAPPGVEEAGRPGRGPLGAHGRRHAVGGLLHGDGRRGPGRDLLGPRSRRPPHLRRVRRAGTREFFTHVRFHKHDEEQIIVHLLVELYARTEDEAIEVLEGAARGSLEITSWPRSRGRPRTPLAKPTDCGRPAQPERTILFGSAGVDLDLDLAADVLLVVVRRLLISSR